MCTCPKIRMAEYFGLLWERIAGVAKALFVSYSSISYFGHVCMSESKFRPYFTIFFFNYDILVYEHVDILWTLFAPKLRTGKDTYANLCFMEQRLRGTREKN